MEVRWFVKNEVEAREASEGVKVNQSKPKPSLMATRPTQWVNFMQVMGKYSVSITKGNIFSFLWKG